MELDGKAVCEDFKSRFEKSGFITQHNFVKTDTGRAEADLVFECAEKHIADAYGVAGVVSKELVYDNPRCDVSKDCRCVSMVVRYSPDAFMFHVVDLFPYMMSRIRPASLYGLVVEASFVPPDRPSDRFALAVPFSSDGLICKSGDESFRSDVAVNGFMFGHIEAAWDMAGERLRSVGRPFMSMRRGPVTSIGLTDSVLSLQKMVTHGVLVAERKKALAVAEKAIRESDGNIARGA